MNRNVFEAYVQLLLNIKSYLYRKEVSIQECAALLGISIVSMYKKRANLDSISFNEVIQLGNHLGIENTDNIVSDYLSLLENLNTLIRNSTWKKKALLEIAGIPFTRGKFLLRKPLGWRIDEVEKILMYIER